MKEAKRITLFLGHYGSGKTNIAVNYALYLKDKGFPVTLADLDIVNPYFRSKDSEREMKSSGIDVISLPFANSNVDLPSLPAEAYSLVQDTSKYAVLDIGGDDRGAYALGRYVPYILEENDFDCFYVVNFHRPLTPDAEDALEVMNEIYAACGIPFTGIVNNSNLGEETTADSVRSTYEKAERLSRLAGVPVALTTVREDLAGAFEDEAVFGLKLQKKYW